MEFSVGFFSVAISPAFWSAEKAGAIRSGLSNCAATVLGTRGSRCRWLRRGTGDYRAACIKGKFTTIGRRQIWKVRIWLTEEATPGTSPGPRPLHPFTCHIGDKTGAGALALKRCRPVKATERQRDTRAEGEAALRQRARPRSYICQPNKASAARSSAPPSSPAGNRCP